MLDILLGPLLGLHQPIITIKNNTISIKVEEVNNPEQYRWINIVEQEPIDYKPCGEPIVVPYYDPIRCFNHPSIYYYDDSSTSIYYYLNQRLDNSLTFFDAPYSPNLKPGDEVHFTTCLWNIKVQLCDIRVQWIKDYQNKVKLK